MIRRLAHWTTGTGWLGLPYALAAFALVAVPLVLTGHHALTEYDALSPARWVGGANFERLWADPMFRLALTNSLTFAALSVPLRLFVAFALALLLARPLPGGGLARALVYLPSVVPEIAFALVWLWLLNPVYGPLAAPFGASWLTDPWGARWALVALSAFQIGEVFIVLLAARRELPHELYELSAVEGASAWLTFRKVTLPLLWPTLVLLAARDVALSLQSTFVPALVITRGGPQYATTFLPLYAYETGFEYLRFGYAAAMTVVTIALTLAMLAVQWAVVELWRARA